MFVRLVADGGLGHGNATGDGVEGQQVDSRHVARGGAAQRLAVEGQVLVAGSLGGRPGAQLPLQGVGIDAAQDLGEGTLTGSGRVSEAEGGSLRRGEVASELGDSLEAAEAAENGGRDEVENGGQAVPLALVVAWVGELGEVLGQGERGSGRRLG
jgi:hypothetical protein